MSKENQNPEANRREHHRLAFEAWLSLSPVPADRASDEKVLRTHLHHALRPLRWLLLDGQHTLVRDAMLRQNPSIAPFLRMIEQKLEFLADDVFGVQAPESLPQSMEMSASGMSFEWHQPLPNGTVWVASVIPADLSRALKLPTRILRCERIDNGVYHVAARFVALSEMEIDALAAWIVTLQARALKASWGDEDEADYLRKVSLLSIRASLDR